MSNQNTTKMNKNCNFSVRELNTISKFIAKCTNFVTMRVNKCGNIDFELRFCKGEGYAHFVLYKRPEGYLFRRRVFDDCPFGTGTYLNNNKPIADLKTALRYFEVYIMRRKDSSICQRKAKKK